MSFVINPYSFGATFNPLSLSPALWLSDTGSDPSVWPDLSGNGRNATQATSTQRPAIVTGAQNGRQVRRFDGTDDFLRLTTGLGMLRNVPGATVIAVYKWITNPVINKSVFFASVNANADLARMYLGGGVASRKLLTGGRRLDSDSFARCDSSADNTNSFFVHSGVVDYANSDLFQYVNGTLDGVNTAFQTSGNTSNTDSSLITVGTAGTVLSNCANVDIAEILVFPTALSTTNRQAVEAYLSNKWGTPTPLPIPLSLSPALWLSDTGSDASVWTDLSGNGRNATQATALAQPTIVTSGISGRQIRRFDGVNDYLQSNSALATTTGTIFVVSQFTDLIVADRVIFQAGTNATKASVGLGIHTNRARKSFIYGSTDILGTATTNATSISCTFNASGNTYYQDGTLVGSVSVTGINCGAGFTVGSLRDGSFTTFYKGDIAEVLVFPTALSTTDRQAVESYLRTKWGTP